MALDIVIDGRRVRDFGIGTYIRSLVHALSRIDAANHYTVVTGPGEARVWGALPDNFRVAIYAGDDHAYSDHLFFPLFLRRLKPDLVHIPLNRVPLLMVRPYVVTIHDMVNLFYDEQKLSAVHMHLRRFRFRRGLMRAGRVIAVSEATKRDVANLLGVPSDR
ncbi:MAG TPA: glycosyltransferase, partial [Bryobacteraceae bacterium]